MGRERRARLRTAAGIAQVRLVCASSAWFSLRVRCARRFGAQHFHEHMETVGDDGLVTVALAGLELSELVAVVSRGSRWWSFDDAPGRALCHAVYKAAAAVLDQVDPWDDPTAHVPAITLTAGAAQTRCAGCPGPADARAADVAAGRPAATGHRPC